MEEETGWATVLRIWGPDPQLSTVVKGTEGVPPSQLSSLDANKSLVMDSLGRVLQLEKLL